MPRASSQRRVPHLPKRSTSCSCVKRRTSPTVATPISVITASVALPTPGIFRTGSPTRNASTWCGRMTKRPSGFFQSEAILARNLFGATPAEAVSCVSARISARIVSAVSVAVGMPVSSSVTSR